jgi:hypothetical protein
MTYWIGYPQTTYVDHLGTQVRYQRGEIELGYVCRSVMYHYFNGFMLLGVL